MSIAQRLGIAILSVIPAAALLSLSGIVTLEHGWVRAGLLVYLVLCLVLLSREILRDALGLQREDIDEAP